MDGAERERGVVGTLPSDVTCVCFIVAYTLILLLPRRVHCTGELMLCVPLPVDSMITLRGETS